MTAPNGSLNDNTYAPDEQGREHVHVMTDRELLEEMVISQRKMADLVNNFFDDFKSGRINPMKMMMQGMMGGKK